jgi:hypothetical protein
VAARRSRRGSTTRSTATRRRSRVPHALAGARTAWSAPRRAPTT